MDRVIANTITKLQMMDFWCKKHKKTLDDFLILDAKYDLFGLIELGCFEFNDRPTNENVKELDSYINEVQKNDKRK